MCVTNYLPPKFDVCVLNFESNINAASINSGNSSESNAPYVEEFVEDQTIINTGNFGTDI